MSDKYIAVIQAGGKGTRLQELTHNRIPKPMLEMNGKPMLEWQIEALVQYEIKDIIIIVGYLGEKIQEYFRDGSRWGGGTGCSRSRRCCSSRRRAVQPRGGGWRLVEPRVAEAAEQFRPRIRM